MLPFGELHDGRHEQGRRGEASNRAQHKNKRNLQTAAFLLPGATFSDDSFRSLHDSRNRLRRTNRRSRANLDVPPLSSPFTIPNDV